MSASGHRLYSDLARWWPFDLVLVHHAIMYAISEDDLRAVFETARRHCRAGGAARRPRRAPPG